MSIQRIYSYRVASLFALWVLTVLIIFHHEKTIRSTIFVYSNSFYKSLEISNKDVQVGNMPLFYLNTKMQHPKGLNKTCGKYPRIYDIEFNNIYWQRLETSNDSYNLLNAYYDERPFDKELSSIRILGMREGYKMDPKQLFCLLWYDGKDKPIITTTTKFIYTWVKGWGIKDKYEPYILTCKLPKDSPHVIPKSVSLVENKCDYPKTNLRVHHSDYNGVKKNFAVCTKGLDESHRDISLRLVEWIEMLRILGVVKVHFYLLQAHPNVIKVLKYYEATGKATVTPITLPGTLPNLRTFQHEYFKYKKNLNRKTEIIPYNDCFYKHRTEYNFISLLDTDEIIMPEKFDWNDAIKDAEPYAFDHFKKPPTSYSFNNLYYMDEHMENETYAEDIPKYFHMLQHVYHSANFTKSGIEHFSKGIHNTSRLLAMHNHNPLQCIGGACNAYFVPKFIGKLNHYRAGCVKALKKATCDYMKYNKIRDTKIWTYKDKLLKSVQDAMKEIPLEPPEI